MKQIIPIIAFLLYILLGFALIGYTNNAVGSGDICKTLFGCFGIWVWLNLDRKEN